MPESRKGHTRVLTTAIVLHLERLEVRQGGCSYCDHRVPIAVRREITTVFQRPVLVRGSVCRNVAYRLRLRGRRDDRRVAQNVALIKDIVRRENREAGTTVVLVTHNVFQAKRWATRVGLMLSGRPIEIGSTTQFFESPADARTAAFVRGEMIC
jgi:tungstate transport system ATP-binding protein